MKILVVGAGVQGKKRALVASEDFAGFLDPEVEFAQYRNINELNHATYDAVAICTPTSLKENYINYFLDQQKHILVEKPLICIKPEHILEMKRKARDKKLVLYTAYNHRFEPSIVFLRDQIKRERLGKIYSIRFFYGNGTARLVRSSRWRDTGLGVIEDLVPHLVDTVLFWLPEYSLRFSLNVASSFENASPDHAILLSQDSEPLISLEVSLCSWKNSFACDVIGERGSFHINGLCKWGDVEVKLRERVLPSGVPTEESITFAAGDPTWRLEYEHFKRLVQEGSYFDYNVDFKIQKMLNEFVDPRKL